MQTQPHRLEDRQEYHVTVTQCLAPGRVPRVVEEVQGLLAVDRGQDEDLF